MGYPIAMEQSQGCCQAGGEKRKSREGVGEGVGADPGGRHKNVRDRPKDKTTDAGDHTEWGIRHGDICGDHMT